MKNTMKNHIELMVVAAVGGGGASWLMVGHTVIIATIGTITGIVTKLGWDWVIKKIKLYKYSRIKK